VVRVARLQTAQGDPPRRGAQQRRADRRLKRARQTREQTRAFPGATRRPQDEPRRCATMSTNSPTPPAQRSPAPRRRCHEHRDRSRVKDTCGSSSSPTRERSSDAARPRPRSWCPSRDAPLSDGRRDAARPSPHYSGTRASQKTSRACRPTPRWRPCAGGRATARSQTEPARSLR
jgi:hypothetical protein